MKHVTLIAVALLAVSQAAMADGFKCESTDGVLSVKAYNHTSPDAGTRNAAVMVISDNTIQYGNKTVAKFTDANETLSNQGALYSARVDLRYNDSGRKGELIGGTKLGQLKTIDLDVDFSYAAPEANGSHVEGMLSLVKRNGDVVSIPMDCARYLKQ
jgi:hypothetical protein